MKQMYASVQELAGELDRQRSIKQDYLVPADKIQFVSRKEDGSVPASEIDLMGAVHPDSGEAVAGLNLNDIAHAQFASRLNIPKRFYDRLRFDPGLTGLLDENVNKLLRHHPEGPPKPWMIRTLGGTCRAALSDSYARIDNFDIASYVLPILRDLGRDVIFRSSAITDKFMYLKAVVPSLTAAVKVGDEVSCGVYIRNSEVGYGKFVIAPFVERLICKNGMIRMRKGAGMMEKIHLGSHLEGDGHGRILSDETRRAKDHAFLLEMRDVVRAAVDEVNFRDLIADMARAAEDEPLQDVTAAVEVLQQREDLTETEGGQILHYLAEGGDLSRWGLLNAVTRTAEDLDSYDRATEFEELGGKLLDYNTRDWRSLATATA